MWRETVFSKLAFRLGPGGLRIMDEMRPLVGSRADIDPIDRLRRLAEIHKDHTAFMARTPDGLFVGVFGYNRDLPEINPLFGVEASSDGRPIRFFHLYRGGLWSGLPDLGTLTERHRRSLIAILDVGHRGGRPTPDKFRAFPSRTEAATDWDRWARLLEGGENRCAMFALQGELVRDLSSAGAPGRKAQKQEAWSARTGRGSGKLEKDAFGPTDPVPKFQMSGVDTSDRRSGKIPTREVRKRATPRVSTGKAKARKDAPPEVSASAGAPPEAIAPSRLVELAAHAEIVSNPKPVFTSPPRGWPTPHLGAIEHFWRWLLRLA